MTLFDTIYDLHEIAEERAKLSGDTVERVIRKRGAVSKIAREFSGGSKICEANNQDTGWGRRYE